MAKGLRPDKTAKPEPTHPVFMSHPASPGEYTEVTLGAFQEVWEAKGWVLGQGNTAAEQNPDSTDTTTSSEEGATS